jgi:sec-independent protein translocase protein TatB
MFNIGFTELLILGVIGLLVVGPEQLPELARKVSRMLNDLKRAKDEIMEPLDDIKSEAQTALLRMRNELEQQNANLGEIAKKATENSSVEMKSTENLKVDSKEANSKSKSSEAKADQDVLNSPTKTDTQKTE